MFIISPVYIIYMIIFMFNYNASSQATYPSQQLAYLFVITGMLPSYSSIAIFPRRSCSALGVISLVVHVLMLVFSFVTYRNYGKVLDISLSPHHLSLTHIL